MKIPYSAHLSKPEYTGENRCWACTIVNLILASAISLVAARRSRKHGLLTFVTSTALIYTRGYLVPGTPTLTKTYLPPEILELFGKEPAMSDRSGLGAIDSEGGDETPGAAADEASGQAGETDDTANQDTADSLAAENDEPAKLLAESGILLPCEQEDDLCLDDGFQERWQAAMRNTDSASISARDAVTVFGLDDSARYVIRNYDGAKVLEADGMRVGQWPSKSALLADIAAAQIIEDEIPVWSELPPEQKGQLLNALRLFLETCPTADGGVELDTDTVESCCRSYRVATTRCTETGEVLFEHRVDQL
ncbi:hypothetical protein [Haloarcula salinisoli]|uniref:Uncharacterized protein n=1 Tax=Haloarcula salinisoli TaxID=2487746 RepID=A0A8J7YBD7_9EURY|nr:hypothetical protein [Halomicroarcula salinisoli]MBX0285589.1 hypothetical protein [Halomicroarcula salinisoli]MBX0302925.1 hypothetical protein [Halomicroarcula salinisoli]